MATVFQKQVFSFCLTLYLRREYKQLVALYTQTRLTALHRYALRRRAAVHSLPCRCRSQCSLIRNILLSTHSLTIGTKKIRPYISVCCEIYWQWHRDFVEISNGSILTYFLLTGKQSGHSDWYVCSTQPHAFFSEGPVIRGIQKDILSLFTMPESQWAKSSCSDLCVDRGNGSLLQIER